MTELAEIVPAELLKLDPETYAAAVYKPFREQLDNLKVGAGEVTYDIATTAGLKTATLWRGQFREIRIGAEKARQERKAPLLEIGRLLDAKAKALAIEVAPFENRFDADIKAEEGRKEAERQAKIKAEQERVTVLQRRIAAIRLTVDAVVGESSAKIDAAWHELDAMVIDESFSEYAAQAKAAKLETMERLHDLYDAKLAMEAEAARLAAERAALAKERAEAAERDRQQAAERAKAEKAAKAAREAEEAAARAQRAAEEADLKRQRNEIAKQQAEINRIQREQQEAAAKVAREALERERAEQQAKARAETEARAQAMAEAREQEEKQRAIKAARRPDDEAIIRALCLAFQPLTRDEVLDWIATFDIEAARARPQ